MIVSLAHRIARSSKRRLAAVALSAVACLGGLTTTTSAHAQAMGTQEEATPRELRSVKVDEQLDAPIPLDATFRDQDGKSVRLGSLIDGKRPTLLTFAYFNCPVLCSLILNSAVSSMSKIPWTIGKEFDVITISIDPHETLERTKSKRESLLGQYGRAEAEHGWHFLVGDEKQIARVTDAVGYRFHYDEESQQFAHPGTLVFLQPNGHVSRYLYGLEYPPTNVRIALLEAAQGKLISTVEQVMLFCYRYDAHEGKYVIVATRVMQVGAGGIGLVLFGFLAMLWYRERKSMLLRVSATPRISGGVGTSSGAVGPMETRT